MNGALTASLKTCNFLENINNARSCYFPYFLFVFCVKFGLIIFKIASMAKSQFMKISVNLRQKGRGT
jgi:hypothetical protein